mmetsp:Transcript_8992/g.22491  ORF Transcript_8992/g.22491 Transcript_8992/m.22491 type:complete len:282 (+) Transcript_8992:784-1629(+)
MVPEADDLHFPLPRAEETPRAVVSHLGHIHTLIDVEVCEPIDAHLVSLHNGQIESNQLATRDVTVLLVILADRLVCVIFFPPQEESAGRFRPLPPLGVHLDHRNPNTIHLLGEAEILQNFGMGDPWIVWVVKEQEDVVPTSDPVIPHKAVDHSVRHTPQHGGDRQAMLVNVRPLLLVGRPIRVPPPAVVWWAHHVGGRLDTQRLQLETEPLPPWKWGVLPRLEPLEDLLPLFPVLWAREDGQVCLPVACRVIMHLRSMQLQPIAVFQYLRPAYNVIEVAAA